MRRPASFPVFRACLAAASGLALSLAVAPEAKAAPPTPSGTFYSVKVPVNNTTPFQLVRYTLSGGSATASGTITTSLTCAANPCVTNSVNGFSYDNKRNIVYFFDNNTANPILNYISIGTGTWGTLGTLNTATNPTSSVNGLAGAAFYNDSIYAITNNSDSLWEIPLTYTGNIPDNLVVPDYLPSKTTLVSPNALSLAGSAYGDIAIDQKGVLYGFTGGAGTRYFYKYDIANDQFLGSTPINTNFGTNLQIAFSSDGTLFGVSNGSGNPWYTFDLATGTPTQYAALTNYGGFSNSTITDLAGSLPVPGPLPLLGAAAAFRASRKLRSKVSAAKNDLTNQV